MKKKCSKNIIYFRIKPTRNDIVHISFEGECEKDALPETLKRTWKNMTLTLCNTHLAPDTHANTEKTTAVKQSSLGNFVFEEIHHNFK